MKCHCGAEMQPTGERLGMFEFCVCLKCHPEYTKQVEAYTAFNKKLWAEHFARKAQTSCVDEIKGDKNE